MDVKLGGADKGTVKVEGPVNKDVIKTGAPIEIPDLTGTYKPGASGKSTLSPGVLTVMAAGTTTTCTPPAGVAVSLELDTSAQPGGASGGGSGGAAGAGGAAASGGGTDSGGGLAATGAEDDGALRALGLVAARRSCWAARCSPSPRGGSCARPADPDPVQRTPSSGPRRAVPAERDTVADVRRPMGTGGGTRTTAGPHRPRADPPCLPLYGAGR